MPATTVAEPARFEAFLAAMPAERQPLARRLWEAVRAAVPAGYTETIGPRFVQFDAGKELYVALANQKNYVSLYLMPLYVFAEHRARLAAAAPKLKTGKSCLNLKPGDDVPLAAIADMLAAHTPEEFLARLQQHRETRPNR
jgi:hypothetical protein